jgi:cytochrome P450
MTQAPAVHGCPIDESFDPLSPGFLADPYAVMGALPREERPIFFAPSIGYYVLTRYADIEQVFRDTSSYSAAVAQAPLVPLVPEAQRILLAGGHKPQPSMVSLDEPEHARLRKPAARAFSMKRVTALVPVIEATTARLLDAVGPAAEFDLVAAKLLEPGDDLTSDLIAIHRENPERLTQEEIASILFSLSFAGHETTTGLIGNTVRRLLEVPQRWSAVTANPSLIPAAVEETLRYDPSVPAWRRVTTRPVTLAGVNLPEGARLFLWLAAAGRDPAAFSQPDVFDVRRPDSGRHLAFGQGLHYCLGANLGKLEAQVAVAALTKRYPRLRLAPDQRPTFHPNISFRGPQVLRVRWPVEACGLSQKMLQLQ